jgi:phospholipase/carboxylesterase
VPAQSDTELITFKGWTLRVRRAARQPARLLLLLHGWTGSESSMWVFVRDFALDYWMLAPRAPHHTRPGGYSWRPLQPDRRESPGLEDLRPAADALITLVDAYRAETGLADDPFDVIGFSQGAALTNTLALLYPARIRRVGVLAGFVPVGAEALLANRPLTGKPFFVAHGTLDEMVKVEYARQSVHLLEQAGATVTFCEDEVGHKLSAGCLRALQTFFA